MVYLNRIYTRTGDQGETSLGDGSRVAKTAARIMAYGTVDELNSLLGLALAATLPEPIASRLQRIQHDLFDVGADLCVPEKLTSTESSSGSELRVVPSQVETLEAWIDEATDILEPLQSFVLPGGTSAAAHLHVARTVCRRAEIAVLQLASCEKINPQIVVYLNRLSDLLFVWARVANSNGQSDVLWIPGKNRTPT